MGWVYKPLGVYPAFFHRTLELGRLDGKVRMSQSSRVSQLDAIRKNFFQFRWCVRQTPSSPLFEIEASHQIRTKITFNHKVQLFELWCEIRPCDISDLVTSNPGFFQNEFVNTKKTIREVTKTV